MSNADDVHLLPAAWLQPLRQLYRQQIVASHAQQSSLKQILSALAEVQIRPILFKGAAWAHILYPTPTCRPMSDFDLWLRAEEIDAAKAALERLGYRQSRRAVRPIELQERRDGELQMIGDDPLDRLVELHWGIFAGEWMFRVARPDREGIRQRVTPTQILGHEVFVLAPEDALIQAAIHISVNHQMTVNAVRSLVDIAWLAQLPIDWSEVATRSRSWRLANAVAFPLLLVNELFAQTLIPPGSHLHLAPARLGWLERFATVESIVSGKQLSATSRRLLYLFGLIDRPEAILTLLGRALWPESSWMIARYGSADLKTRLVHALSTATGTV